MTHAVPAWPDAMGATERAPVLELAGVVKEYPGDPPVVARIQEGRLVFDLRALTEREDRLLEEAVRKLFGGGWTVDSAPRPA